MGREGQLQICIGFQEVSSVIFVVVEVDEDVNCGRILCESYRFWSFEVQEELIVVDCDCFFCVLVCLVFVDVECWICWCGFGCCGMWQVGWVKGECVQWDGFVDGMFFFLIDDIEVYQWIGLFLVDFDEVEVMFVKDVVVLVVVGFGWMGCCFFGVWLVFVEFVGGQVVEGVEIWCIE